MNWHTPKRTLIALCNSISCLAKLFVGLFDTIVGV